MTAEAEIQVLEPGATTPAIQKETEINILQHEPVPSDGITFVHSQLSFPLEKVVLLGSLPDDRLRLAKPLKATVKSDVSGYVACSGELEEFGYGDDAYDAVDDLRETICELFWSLREDEDKLGDDLKGVLKKLNTRIEIA